jgi:hypothetical protein
VSYQVLTPSFPNNYNFSSSQLFIVPVPEPGSALLSISGGMMLLIVTRRRARH